MRLAAIAVSIAIVALVGSAGPIAQTTTSAPPAGSLPARKPDLANGETMFNIGGCASCHATTELKDRTRLGGGLELKTAFGTFRAPNISPDGQHGIGAWSERQFADAMLTGVGRNGEHLYPVFPYTSYQRMRLDDVRDLYAYLKTLPQEKKPSKPHELSFPYSVRAGLGLWKRVYLDGRPFTPDPAKDARHNRGAYLTEGPGHCAECHSPRNVMGGIVSEKRYAGGIDAEGKGWVPNITPHADGIPDWSVKDMQYFLETGATPDAYTVASPMTEVIDNTSRLSAADREAMSVYLRALPPRPGRSTLPKKN